MYIYIYTHIHIVVWPFAAANFAIFCFFPQFYSKTWQKGMLQIAPSLRFRFGRYNPGKCLNQQPEEVNKKKLGLQFGAFSSPKKGYWDISDRFPHPTTQKTATKFNITAVGVKNDSHSSNVKLGGLWGEKSERNCGNLKHAKFAHQSPPSLTLQLWESFFDSHRCNVKLRNGYGVPLPELGGENSYCHLPIARCPKETGRLLVCLDAHGLVDSLSQLPCMRSRSTRENSLDSMSGLLLSHGPFGQFL